MDRQVATVIDDNRCTGCGWCMAEKDWLRRVLRLLGKGELDGYCSNYCASVMKNGPANRAALGIPADESIHAVVALGYPAETCRRCAGRKPAVVRYAG